MNVVLLEMLGIVWDPNLSYFLKVHAKFYYFFIYFCQEK